MCNTTEEKIKYDPSNKNEPTLLYSPIFLSRRTVKLFIFFKINFNVQSCDDFEWSRLGVNCA